MNLQFTGMPQLMQEQVVAELLGPLHSTCGVGAMKPIFQEWIRIFCAAWSWKLFAEVEVPNLEKNIRYRNELDGLFGKNTWSLEVLEYDHIFSYINSLNIYIYTIYIYYIYIYIYVCINDIQRYCVYIYIHIHYVHTHVYTIPGYYGYSLLAALLGLIGSSVARENVRFQRVNARYCQRRCAWPACFWKSMHSTTTKWSYVHLGVS